MQRRADPAADSRHRGDTEPAPAALAVRAVTTGCRAILVLVPDQRIEKWKGWIEGTVTDDVLTMHLQREAWRDVSKIIQDNGQLPESYWWEFMRDTYAITQAVAVRRQADTHKDVASLGKVIQEIRGDPSRITRGFWIGLWDESDPVELAVAERAWTDQYAGSVRKHLDPSIPAADFDALTAAASNVKRYVDQHVAHADSSAPPESVTVNLKDVHDAVEVIGDLFRKYYNLLTAVSYTSVVPVIQHDWQAVFRQPWIRPGKG